MPKFEWKLLDSKLCNGCTFLDCQHGYYYDYECFFRYKPKFIGVVFGAEKLEPVFERPENCKKEKGV